MKKVLLRISAALLTVFTLAACGHDEPSDEIEVSENSELSQYGETTEETSLYEEETEPESEETTEAETEEYQEMLETSEAGVLEEIAETETYSYEDVYEYTEENEDILATDFFKGIELGMSQEEVFAVAGSDSDDKIEENVGSSIEYVYVINEDVFGIEGYMFFEFDVKDDTLVTYGYHLGRTTAYDAAETPCSEEKLKEVYDNITAKLINIHGAGEESDSFSDLGVKKELNWYTDKGRIWAVYGVGLWDYPGLNEIIVSCSNKGEN